MSCGIAWLTGINLSKKLGCSNFALLSLHPNQSHKTMKKTFITALGFALIFGVSGVYAQGQTRTNKKDSRYQFTIDKEVGNTSVKSQDHTGTCWSYSGGSFLESEVERMGKGKVDLSEMFTVRKAYSMKANNYVRMGGKTNYGQGGAFHDVINVLRAYGVAPQESYTGMIYGQKKHNHSELDAVAQAMLGAIVKNPEGKLNPAWKKAVESVYDAYLGQAPERFSVGGKSYTPAEYAKFLGLNADNYVEITSFTHHPFYSQFMLEVPDNWSWDLVYNVPLNEFEQIIDNALANNYTVAWASDVSEKGWFSFKDGLAIVPDKDLDAMSKGERDSLFTDPVVQKTITQELRQEGFDNQSTTDDHGMQIVGSAKDQKGTKYYIVKNSWGSESNECGGYFYASAAFVMYKTTCILVNKASIPAPIASKLKLK